VTRLPLPAMRKLLEFHRSPNAVKVRVALNYKGLEYEIEEMMAADREPMLEAAGWPMIPILIDGDVVMRDSLAILHYLEANYHDAPSLTPGSRDEIRTAEALLANLSPEILRIQWGLSPQFQRPEPEREESAIAEARESMRVALERLERRLADGDWLVGDTMSIYDIVLACNLLPTRPPERFAEQSPIWRFFADHFRLNDDASIAGWIDRVVDFDDEWGGPPA
jgi:glutathione S-transferase